ncbi:MAG TPA: ABC transporter permease [Gemmatimonadaceae bacterium]
MFRGLFRLTWIELKIFFREPLGAIGTVLVPVLLLVVGGMASQMIPQRRFDLTTSYRVDVPVFAAVMISLNAVLSLVAIIAIYREGGVLKRLRATPLRPQTILTAHVLVKLILTAAALGLALLAGKQFFPLDSGVPVIKFGAALLITTCSILSIGFVIASIVPTPRFAQPIGAVILYPMLAYSGLFVPLADMPPGLRAVAKATPLSYSVSLLRGIWTGESWSMHTGDILALAIVFVLCTAISTKVFRWE